MLKRLMVVLALVVAGFGVAAPAVADSVQTEYPSCNINGDPAEWATGTWFTDPDPFYNGNQYAVYRLGSEQTGGSGSACEDINFTPIGPDLWNDRTFARVYVCPPVGSCYLSNWVWVGSWGGVVMPGVPNSMWYYIEWASRGSGGYGVPPSQNPFGNVQTWD